MTDQGNYFKELNEINVNDKTEKKGKLTYLSWAWAWAELKKIHPDAFYTIYENSEGWNYFHDGQTCWVKTGVTVCGLEHIEYLPVMDYNNKSIPLGSVTSVDVNKSIQRSLTKAVARHGLGLYIYAGEDLPEEPEATQAPKKATPKKEAGEEGEPEKNQTHREMFREYLAEKKPDKVTVVRILQEAGAQDDSPDEVWFNALRIAKKKLG